MIPVRQALRLCLDVVPPLALAACTVLLAWQMAHDRAQPALQQAVLAGALVEICGALLDASLAESLAERLAWRVVGWIAAHAVIGGIVLAVASHARELEPATWLLVAAFVVPRFVTFVLMPPRDELARRRLKALARDRLEAVFIGITLVPVAAVATVLLGSSLAISPSVLVPAVGLGLLAAWFLLVAVAAAIVGSPAFELRPRRLLTRGIWPWLVHPFPGAWRTAAGEWRREEAGWEREQRGRR